MDIEPKPIDPDTLRAIEHYLSHEGKGAPLPNPWALELLADRAWHRARVAVTDDDIREAGLGDPADRKESPGFVAWLGHNGFEYGGSGVASHYTIGSVAADVGKAPLDVLAEIAATEVPRG